MLTAAYCVALTALFGGWWKWRYSLERASFSSCLKRTLLFAYWNLAATLLGGIIASRAVVTDDVTPFQFRVLATLIVGMVPQAALFGFVLTPMTMRGRFKDWSFLRSVVVIECCVVIPSIFVAGCLLWMAMSPEKVGNAFAR